MRTVLPHHRKTVNLSKGKMRKKKDYFDKKELDKQKKIDAGLVSDCYPTVFSIVVYMRYYKKLSDTVSMIRTVNFFPSNYAYFHMACIIKECMNGGFELTPVIKSLIKKRKKSGTGKMVCGGKNDGLSSGHTNISYEINIKYNKRRR
jgi:hypothetical protein